MNELGIMLLELMGGSDNISSLTHCATRLRPTFKDRSKVDAEGIKNLAEVIGIVDNDTSFQIIIGTNVGEVYEAIRVHMSYHSESEDVETGNESLINRFVSLVVSIFSPLLPLLAGAGLLRGFTILANELGILSVESDTNTLLTLAATSVFYFFPLLVAITSAKKFKTSAYIAIAVLGVLIMPDFVAMMNDQPGTIIQFMGLPIRLFSYTGQVIPSIILVWLQSKMEFFLKKVIPQSLHMVVIPTILLFLLVPIVAGIIGPIGNYVSLFIADVVGRLTAINSIVTGAIIGGIWNILIMFGFHWAPNTMIIIPEIAATGTSALIAYGANANFGMAGAALAIFIMTKNKDLKNFSLSAITSVFLSGIVEPAIYGIGVKYKTPLAAGCIGAAIGGAFMGAFEVIGNAFVFGGLTTIPAFAGPTLWAYLVGLLLSFIGGLVLTFVFGVKGLE
ncbi:PTS beta-glucoside transporter subunit IIABC [Enterococcus casseliflavus]|jgi:PTS system beta-glucosides-specific IIC component|uniref:PTS transporter subunit EIIC n=1 Tax=Enterococcus casseliflavus TaxID=37734 RepID=UPI000FFBC193|nr:PTS transporter subunit EIIC [Enterococcus casseliflavus]RXA58877.1 PTS beta-glucoside transporter subunit IIABC [Enterococcus casseliflavus]